MAKKSDDADYKAQIKQLLNEYIIAIENDPEMTLPEKKEAIRKQKDWYERARKA
jgi:hypothetical protein